LFGDLHKTGSFARDSAMIINLEQPLLKMMARLFSLKNINKFSILIWSLIFVAKSIRQDSIDLFLAYILTPLILILYFLWYDSPCCKHANRTLNDIGAFISINVLSFVLFFK
jgi:hypothetical protein